MIGLVWDFPGRVARSVDKRGVRGAVAEVWRRTVRRLYLREAHCWLQLDLAGDRPRAGLAEPIVVRQVPEEDLAMIEQLGTFPLEEARRRHREGARLWVAQAGEQVAIACWVFEHAVPAIAARDGLVRLRPGVVSLEDLAVGTLPRTREGLTCYRGTFTSICDHYQALGYDRLITKVELGNSAVRNRTARVGLQPIAEMRLLRIAGFSRVRLSGLRGAEAQFLSSQLTR
ncbi:hypothetical protein [Pseudonocardia charpentierae]|uniref:N-acetyltransferase domain-containing protein n=1 Tax=Pseudonocardia charpentierae TaxID=3075545 RepID=A0ABU2NHR8_9PSEU|nr:hypothetical protein [Pseudonocardia sp. DSM 45834]MDT0353505.1 hypothetical protein [Pseudonocardia sp. DSM 45834]